MTGKPRDITGNRYGRLVVIKDSGKRNASRSALWLCKCDCGNEKIANGTDLRRGDTQSCGCLRKENIRIIGRRSYK